MSQLSKVDKPQGNTHPALDCGLQVVHKRRVGIHGLRDDLKEAIEGRQKAKMEAEGLRVEVEILQKAKEDLMQRLGVAKAHVGGPPSTLSATFRA